LPHEQTPRSNDTIDSVLRHQEVGRAKDLSAPPRIVIGYRPLQHNTVISYRPSELGFGPSEENIKTDCLAYPASCSVSTMGTAVRIAKLTNHLILVLRLRMGGRHYACEGNVSFHL